MTDIIAFQAGREARIANKRRDGRRCADWLRGWDQVDDDLDRFTRDHKQRTPPMPVDSNTRSDSVGWQDIATAPRDGTPILLWATRMGCEGTGFNRVVGYHDRHGWSIFGAGGPEPVSGHVEQPDYRVQRLDSCEPIAWMPLPTPPALEERRG